MLGVSILVFASNLLGLAGEFVEEGSEPTGQAAPAPVEETREATMTLAITSPAFPDSERIPVRHTADGKNLSPELTWSGAPPGTKSFALVCDDPDAPRGSWVHWLIFNIPASVTSLPEGVPADPAVLAGGAVQGLNSWGKVGYLGPSPPAGKPHRYFFRLFALDASLALTSRAVKTEIDKAMQGHVLAEATIMGTYGR